MNAVDWLDIDPNMLDDDQARALYEHQVDTADLGFDPEPVDPRGGRLDTVRFLNEHRDTRLASVSRCRSAA